MSDEPAAHPEVESEAASEPVSRASERSLTEAELAEMSGYEDLREALRAARNDSDASQMEIAAILDVGQSEVSRLETSIGPGSRLGRIKRYLNACGAEFELAVRTKAGQVFLIWTPEGDDLHGAGTGLPHGMKVLEQPYAVVNVSPETELVKFVLTMEDSLQDLGITGVQSRKFRDSFFRNLRHYQPATVEVARVDTAGSVPRKVRIQE